MNGGNIFRSATRLVSDTIGTIQSTALNNVKLRTGMSDQALAERLGKRDRKSATSYLTGGTTLDLTAFLNAISDPELGDEFGNDVLSVVNRRLCPVVVDAVPVEQVAVDLASFLAELLGAWSDRDFNHREKVRLAKLMKPLMPKLAAIVAAGDAVTA